MKLNLDDILSIIKLLSSNLKDDMHRTNIGMLYEKTLESFSWIWLEKSKGTSIFT